MDITKFLRIETIPAIFKPFTGYNQPQLSKHRKRKIESMSSTSLRVCADALFGCLQGVYWDQSPWKQLKPDVLQLANSLSEYADYLMKQQGNNLQPFWKA